MLLFSLLPWPNLCPCLLAVGLSAAPCTWLLPGLDLWPWTPVVTLPSCLLPRPVLTLGTSHSFRSSVVTGFSPLLIPTSASLSMAESSRRGLHGLYSSFPPLPPDPSLKGEDDLSHLGRPPWPGGSREGLCGWLCAGLLKDVFCSLHKRLSRLCVHKLLPLSTLEKEI